MVEAEIKDPSSTTEDTNVGDESPMVRDIDKNSEESRSRSSSGTVIERTSTVDDLDENEKKTNNFNDETVDGLTLRCEFVDHGERAGENATQREEVKMGAARRKMKIRKWVRNTWVKMASRLFLKEIREKKDKNAKQKDQVIQ